MEYVAIWFVCACIGAVIGSGKSMGGGSGFALGLLLGPIGILIALVSSGKSTLQKVEARPADPGWHPDPLGRFDQRWYDGTKWTQHVGRVQGDQRQQLEDPL